MKKYTKQLLGIGFFILLFLLTIYTIFKDQSIFSLLESLKNIKLGYLVIGCLLMVLFIFCDALKLKITLGTLKQKTSIIKTMGYSFVGFYFNSITPSASGGQVAQVYYMSKDGVNLSHSSLTLLLTTIIYQIGIIIYSSLMYLINYSFIQQNLSNFNGFITISLFLNIIIVGILITLIFSKKLIRRILFASLNFLVKIRILKNSYTLKKKGLKFLSEYNAGADYIKKHPKMILKLFVVTLMQLTILFFIPYLVYLSFSLTQHTAVEMITIQSLLTLTIFVLPLPGGMGVSENIFLLMFKLFYTSSLLLPAMVLSRFISFYGILLLSGIITLIVHFFCHKKIGAFKPAPHSQSPYSY